MVSVVDRVATNTQQYVRILREEADKIQKTENEPNKFCILVSFYNCKAELARLLDSMQPDIYEGMDKLIFADGVYFGLDKINGNDLSTDGSRELVASYDKAVLLDAPNLLEMHKRELLTYHAKKYECNFGIIIDSDEHFAESQQIEPGLYFERNWDRFKSNAIHEARSHYKEQYNLFAMWLELGAPAYVDCVADLMGRPEIEKTRRDEPRRWQYHPRLWFRPWEVRYWLSHYTFVRRDEVQRFMELKRQFRQYVSIPAVSLVDGIRILHDQALRDQAHLERRKNYEADCIQFEQYVIPERIRKSRRNDEEQTIMDVDLYELYEKTVIRGKRNKQQQ